MSQPSPSIGYALQTAVHSIDRMDAIYLLCFATKRKRAFLAAYPEQPLTHREAALFDTLVASRSMGVPVAYLTNGREFYGRDFLVDARALIPRPETETLVDAALARLPTNQPARVLDIGTGTGIVGISLALERPAITVLATDVSAEALQLADENAARHALCAPRWQGVLGATYAPVAGQKFALVVSNPPYISGSDGHLMQGDLRFEPRVALSDGSADGLATLREIVSGARQHLAAGGWLLLEHGHDQAAAVGALLDSAGFLGVFCERDLAGVARVTGGRIQAG